jgi:hypothetical protein
MDELIDLRSTRPVLEFDLSNKRAIEVLQMEYRGEIELTPQQRRSAMACLPYEEPKLAVIGHVAEDGTFAERLERALNRSGLQQPKLIEHQSQDADD